MLVVADQPNTSRQVQEALRELLEPLLKAGPDSERYAGYIEVLDDAWRKVQARSTFDWGLDVADLLISERALPGSIPSGRVSSRHSCPGLSGTVTSCPTARP